MPDARCGICGESFDEGSDHTFCRAAAIAAVLNLVINRNSEAKLGNEHFQAHFESVVGIPADGSDGGRWRGYVTVTWWNEAGVRRQIYSTADSFATPEEAAAECDDMYEEFLEYCRLRGNVTILEDPTDGRSMN